MSNILRLPKVNPLSVCPTTPHPQPTPLALRSAAAAVSQVDPLCATPLKNYMTPCQKKINWNTALHVLLHTSIDKTRLCLLSTLSKLTGKKFTEMCFLNYKQGCT